MTIKTRQLVLPFAAALLATSVQAADVRWSGYGTFGAGQVLDDDARYDANPILIDGDLEDKVSYSVLSQIGLQADVSLGDGLSATVQIKATGSENWEADVSWAYLTYDLSNNVKVQAGRKLLPIYNYTDSIDVGYTYHWIRPPADVYSVAAIAYDGVNISYQDFYGDWEISANGLTGRVEGDDGLYDNYDTSYRVTGGNIEATYDDWVKLRFAVFSYKDFELEEEVESGPAIPMFDSLYYGTSLSATPGNWLLMSEYTWYDIDNDDFIPGVPGTKLLNDLDQAWYVSAAYTMGQWTPHLTYSHKEFADEGYNLGQSAAESSTIIAGLRYDFHPAASLKIEYHMFEDDTTTAGFDTPRDGNDEVDSILVAIDYVF